MKSRIWEKAVNCFAWLCGIVLFGAVSTLVSYLVIKGWPALNLELIFGTTPPLQAILFKQRVFDGLFPAILGTLALVVCSVAIAAPMGVAAGIYMAEYAKPPVKTWFSLFFDVLAGIPSIVVGLFGFSVTIFLHQHFFDDLYPCLIVSAVSLAFLVLPYMIRTTQTSLENHPFILRHTGLSLGATKLQNIFYVLLPESFSAILTGLILSIGRCAEDTAVIMLTGVVAQAGVPTSLFSNYEALPFYIYYISSQYMDAEELSKGFGAAVILLFTCTTLYLLAWAIHHIIQYKQKKKI